MKLAGRCRRGIHRRRPRARSSGANSSSAASIARVTSSVLAPHWLESVSSTPGGPARARRRTSARRPPRRRRRRRGAARTPSRTLSTVSPSAAAEAGSPTAASGMRWFSVSTKPTPRIATASRAAATRSALPMPCASSVSGRRRICVWRTSPPKRFTRATPGTASRRGRSVHSASARSSSGDSRSETSPILSTSIVADVSGERRGVPTPCGKPRRDVADAFGEQLAVDQDRRWRRRTRRSRPTDPRSTRSAATPCPGRPASAARSGG